MEKYRSSKILLTWSTGTDTLGIVALLEKTVDTTNWELEPNFRLVIALLNKRKLLACAVSFLLLNRFLIGMKLVLKKKEKRNILVST